MFKSIQYPHCLFPHHREVSSSNYSHSTGLSGKGAHQNELLPLTCFMERSKDGFQELFFSIVENDSSYNSYITYKTVSNSLKILFDYYMMWYEKRQTHSMN